MAGKRPYFPFYVADFASDAVVTAMTMEQVGAYITLLCVAWQQDPQGSIPDDDRKLATWCRLSIRRWSAIKDGVLAAFKKHGGRWIQKRLTEEAQKLADRAIINAENGARGGRPKKTESVISGLYFGSDSVSNLETETKAYAGARAGSGYGFGSESENSKPNTSPGQKPDRDPAGELAAQWAFFCARKRRGIVADTAHDVIDEFREALRLGLPFETIRDEIKRDGRDKREYLWQFWKRLHDAQASPDVLDGLRVFIERGESHEAV